MRSTEHLITLNSNVKALKFFDFNKKRLILVQVMSNKECYIVDESKLTEEAKALVKQYIPGD